MFKLIDRLLIRGYLKAYVVCLVSLLSLFIVVDLFTNLDDFTGNGRGLNKTLSHILTYYGYKSAYIFDKLSEAIILLAAMFTVAWVQRNNELLPLLSAGVSTRRVVAPVLGCACAMLSLTALNQELLIPRISTYLLQPKDDPTGEKETEVRGCYEPNGIHVEGTSGVRGTQTIRPFFCTVPETFTGFMLALHAREGRYVPPEAGRPWTGGWLLTGVTESEELKHWDRPDVLEMIDPGKYFLRTSEVDFETMTRPRNWFTFASTLELSRELQRPDSLRLAPMAVLFHMRLTRPVLGILLVFLGLSVILRDQNRNVFISAGLCLLVCGVFFVAIMGCKSFGDDGTFSPVLAAWLPVLTFGPLGFVMFDAVHT